MMIDKILKIKIGEEKAKEFIRNIKKEKGGKEKMMTVFETIEQDNKRIFRRGKKEGREETVSSYIKNMIKENLPIELISKITGLSQQEINKMK